MKKKEEGKKKTVEAREGKREKGTVSLSPKESASALFNQKPGRSAKTCGSTRTAGKKRGLSTPPAKETDCAFGGKRKRALVRPSMGKRGESRSFTTSVLGKKEKKNPP